MMSARGRNRFSEHRLAGRSANGFCQGDFLALMTWLMPRMRMVLWSSQGSFRHIRLLHFHADDQVAQFVTEAKFISEHVLTICANEPIPRYLR